ncbi:MAG: DEAD/DEAH box helicase [Planctomycetota bacterium]
MTTFASLNLSTRLLKNLATEGYETPTPIQAQAIPPVLEGRDLLACAQTGTGKTAAFSLPIIERLAASVRKSNKHAPRRARALILAPTRELAAQIADNLLIYGRNTGLRHAVIYGGVKQYRQVRQLEAGVEILVATPGRLLDLMDQGHVDLGAIETFVLDEADRMLDMGFIEPIRQIGQALPRERQTLFFSATMPPKIRQLADSMLHDPASVSVTPVASTAPLIDQTLYHVPGEHKTTLLTHLLQDAKIVRAVVFTKTKHGAEKLAKKLSRSGMTAGAIHGNKSQNQRQRALDAFRSGRSRVLVATDVAARGIDVDGITHVFNFNLPNEPEAYVHRIGRTGRAGATGQAISFCSRDERGYLRAIERLSGDRIHVIRVPQELDLPEETPSATKRRPLNQAKRRPQKPRQRTDSRPDKPGDKSATKKSAKPGSKRRRRKNASSAGKPHAKQSASAGNRSRGKAPRRASSRPR